MKTFIIVLFSLFILYGTKTVYAADCHPMTQEAYKSFERMYTKKCIDMTSSHKDVFHNQTGYCMCVETIFINNLRDMNLSCMEEVQNKLKQLEASDDEAETCYNRSEGK